MKILKQIIQKLEKLEEEKHELTELIKETYAQSRSIGLEPKIVKKVVALRKKGLDVASQENEMIEKYMQALESDDV
ncbi:GapR family DNA-binding domain-containing protein [Candidatus Fokinia crypta]|uniref:DUF2312 domain-containing protein n=1 Tax=Candidatus Fokinia crypta TaxID=1920990 RepID=A0ABZ0UNX0_9RICK|nr:GapR family DNA-binding domain-containing protein [Candidatus Fokinia cryptica]WPX97587.1 DUF2312 domain-containing protein [Candidatus Fokinia cryptica]